MWGAVIWMVIWFFLYLHSTYGVCVCLVTQSCPTLCDPLHIAHQAPLSMEFSRQENWSGLSFPPLGDLLENWTFVSYVFCTSDDSLLTEPWRKPSAHIVAIAFIIVLDWYFIIMKLYKELYSLYPWWKKPEIPFQTWVT